MTPEMWTIAISFLTLIVTIVLAFIGYFATYYYNLRLTRHQHELELVNRQMDEFYGPLYVATEAGRMAFRALLNKFGRHERIFEEEASLTAEELAEWRLWVTQVFMPINEFRERLILDNAYLIREEKMPQCLLDYVTHVSSYKPLMEKWRQGDFSEHRPLIFFPRELDAYAERSYSELKVEQLKLIGKLQDKVLTKTN